MGLDMYLSGRKFLPQAWDKKRADRMEDGHRIKEVVLELGYWRKHPNLHGYIVNTFGPKDKEGQPIDDCKPIDLNVDAIDQILAAVREHKLPPTTGFFFGKSCDPNASTAEEREWAKREYDDTIAIFEGAKAWLISHSVWDEEAKRWGWSKTAWPSVEYEASW